MTNPFSDLGKETQNPFLDTRIRIWIFPKKRTLDPNTARPVLEVGDIIVVDNFAAHHGDAERALRSFFDDLGMELLYLPAYSPDFNPDEEVFSKLKYLLKYRYEDIVFDNLEYAVWCAVGDLEAADMYGYYRHAGYLI